MQALRLNCQMIRPQPSQHSRNRLSNRRLWVLTPTHFVI
jgi:hypothetical protein